jgi:hypothetical protein
VEVHLEDGDRQVDADGKRGHAGEQAKQDQQAPNEFGKRGKIGSPGWEPEAGDELSMVLETAENLVLSVVEHDGTQGEAHDEECKGLQAVEMAHGVLRWRKIDYRNRGLVGSGCG